VRSSLALACLVVQREKYERMRWIYRLGITAQAKAILLRAGILIMKILAVDKRD